MRDHRKSLRRVLHLLSFEPLSIYLSVLQSITPPEKGSLTASAAPSFMCSLPVVSSQTLNTVNQFIMPSPQSSQISMPSPQSNAHAASEGTSNSTNPQNSSLQNGIANTSDPPSASMSEFMQFSTDPENRELHDAIARGAQPNGGDETHTAGEIASVTLARSILAEMTDVDREEMGLVGTGTGNDVVPNAHPESQITAISQPPDRPSNNHDAHPRRDHAAARHFDFPTVYLEPSSDSPNIDYYELFMDHEDDTLSTRASAARNEVPGIEFNLLSGGNELAASVGSLQIGQHNGSITTSHTIVN
ncbi:hypothetical protein BCR34DRAFT_221917 [Clohesyomyces aquaticus]|uniref:Uncharacterized protein n=1 Tax=Clohesyomyces aquaticus TaxID=1231657 RepID=A0A1Y1Y8S6_9PLEO|nr:hypothetical protein BCR34DRAFT_221917 [Clohesyomyces aquaticus]